MWRIVVTVRIVSFDDQTFDETEVRRGMRNQFVDLMAVYIFFAIRYSLVFVCTGEDLVSKPSLQAEEVSNRFQSFRICRVHV